MQKTQVWALEDWDPTCHGTTKLMSHTTEAHRAWLESLCTATKDPACYNQDQTQVNKINNKYINRQNFIWWQATKKISSKFVLIEYTTEYIKSISDFNVLEWTYLIQAK